MTKLERFKQKHPVCCFCAGERPTESLDHQPPRVFFKNKRFPDQIAVPACKLCQSASREAENVLSLAVIGAEPSEFDVDNWRKRYESVRRRTPHLLPRTPKNTREARALLGELGTRPPPGMLYSEVPIFTLDTEAWAPLFEMLGRKLCLAFHYRCFRKPLTCQGRGFARVFTNAAEMPDLSDIFHQLPQLEIGTHGSEDLGDQISTRWHANETGRLFLFMTRLQSQLFVVGGSGETEQWRQFVDRFGGGFPPFD